MFMQIVNRTEEAIIRLLLVATTLLVFLDVVMRFGFNTGFMWTQELTLHMSAWFVLFGTSYGLKVGAHIGMDALIRAFPPMGRRVLTMIGCILGLTYCGLVIYGSWIYLYKIRRIGIELEDIEIEAWIAHSILVIGIGFLAIRIFNVIVQVITGKRDGFPRANEADDSMEIAKDITDNLEEALNGKEDSK